jgi:hypothetical protein
VNGDLPERPHPPVVSVRPPRRRHRDGVRLPRPGLHKQSRDFDVDPVLGVLGDRPHLTWPDQALLGSLTFEAGQVSGASRGRGCSRSVSRAEAIEPKRH